MNKMILNVILAAAMGTTALAAELPQAPGPATAESTNAVGPKIAFDSIVFDFGKAKEGELVKHTYVFTNIGDQLLEISAVQPSCGCTTAGEWTHKVEPGKCGTMAIQFNTAHQNPSVFKTITVTCTDKSNPRPVLQLKGTIWKPIEVTPQFAVLNVSADAPNPSTTVRIINNQEEPFTLSPPESNNKAFSAELKTVQPGKEYQVVVTAQSPLNPGSVQAQISLKSTSATMPVVTITAFANVTAPVTVSPPAIGLPPAPLLTAQTNSVNITYNSTNRLTFEPAVNDSRVDVQLKEVQPGKTYVASLIFPQGFDIAQGKQVELTIKSSNPSLAPVKVPVSQAPRLNAPQLMQMKSPMGARMIPPPQTGIH